MEIHEKSVPTLFASLFFSVQPLLSDDHVFEQDLHTEPCTITPSHNPVIEYKIRSCYASLQDVPDSSFHALAATMELVQIEGERQRERERESERERQNIRSSN